MIKLKSVKLIRPIFFMKLFIDRISKTWREQPIFTGKEGEWRLLERDDHGRLLRCDECFESEVELVE